MPQPWDVPPSPATGDPHEDAISLAVGRALTAWEFVEEQLAELFAIFVNADMADLEKAPAVRAYGWLSPLVAAPTCSKQRLKRTFSISPTNSYSRALMQFCEAIAASRDAETILRMVGADKIPQILHTAGICTPDCTTLTNIQSGSRRNISIARLKLMASEPSSRGFMTKSSTWRRACRERRRRQASPCTVGHFPRRACFPLRVWVLAIDRPSGHPLA
jgi:hypothetical protein